jgi:hypothetical protein
VTEDSPRQEKRSRLTDEDGAKAVPTIVERLNFKSQPFVSIVQLPRRFRLIQVIKLAALTAAIFAGASTGLLDYKTPGTIGDVLASLRLFKTVDHQTAKLIASKNIVKLISYLHIYPDVLVWPRSL